MSHYNKKTLPCTKGTIIIKLTLITIIYYIKLWREYHDTG